MLLGHSLAGRVIGRMELDHPEFVKKLYWWCPQWILSSRRESGIIIWQSFLSSNGVFRQTGWIVMMRYFRIKRN